MRESMDGGIDVIVEGFEDVVLSRQSKIDTAISLRLSCFSLLLHVIAKRRTNAERIMRGAG